jgi:hypothetical protein
LSLVKNLPALLRLVGHHYRKSLWTRGFNYITHPILEDVEGSQAIFDEVIQRPRRPNDVVSFLRFWYIIKLVTLVLICILSALWVHALYIAL